MIDRPPRLRIAQVAPPLERVPPVAYGGTERIVHELTTELVRRGHDVTVFASGDSDVPTRLVPTVDRALRPAGIEGDAGGWFASTVKQVVEQATDFDVIHSHLEWWSLPLARVSPVPVVATFHGRLDLPWADRLFQDAPRGMVAISRHQAHTHPNVPWTIIHNGLSLDRAPFGEGPGERFCFVGRVDAEKGIIEAIEIAVRTGRPLRIAAKVGNLARDRAYYEDAFVPALKRAGPLVEYLGELGPADRDRLFAESYATLMPGAWPEPFGLVSIESLACGTPVLASRAGALPEIIRDGVDGFFGDDAAALAFYADRVGGLDRLAIRERVIDRFSAARMTDRYEELYTRMAGEPGAAGPDDGANARMRSAVGIPVIPELDPDLPPPPAAAARSGSSSRPRDEEGAAAGPASTGTERPGPPPQPSPGWFGARVQHRPLTPPVAHRDAAASGLRYVSPDGPGIRRRRAGRGFVYIGLGGRPIRSARELARIRAIVIPPAWTDVWICPRPDGHIQAIGRDARGRRQYRYHAGFRARRDRGKFARLVRFAERLPRIRRRVREDLRRPGLPREKVLAAVLTLLEATRLRVGNPQYARLNRSFGLSTLRDRHARVTGTTVRFRFRGKGGRTEERELVDRRLAGLIRRCQDLPGQDLFQYVDDEGSTRAIRSEDVNEYLRDAAGSDDVSAKDFRTWTATVLAFKALHQVTAEDKAHAEAAEAAAAGARAGESSSAAGGPRRKKRRNPIVEALRRTAEELGDTVAVTRSAYVHPGVLEAFDGDGAPPSSGRASARDLDGPTDRRTELEVLALLRRAERATRAAKRLQVGGAAVAGRARRRRA